jgi:putative transposase
MRNRRDRRNPNKMVVHVTNRTLSGLPFLARLFMKWILLGIMARCQEHHRVRIAHFNWMSNHFHMILVGEGKHISSFMGEMESAVARAIKKLTPQYRRNVWDGRFKEQRLLTHNDVIDKIVYIYINPVKAGLVAHADDWEGCSSFRMYKSGSLTVQGKYTSSTNLRKLPQRLHKISDAILLKMLNMFPHTCHELKITPDAWKNCFEESKNLTSEEIFKTIMTEISKREEEIALERKGHFMGMRKVQQQSINIAYVPKKKTRTPYLICWIKELRIKAIAEYKAFCEECRKAWKKWRQGDISAKFVYGAFRPSMPIVGRLCGVAT